MYCETVTGVLAGSASGAQLFNNSKRWLWPSRTSRNPLNEHYNFPTCESLGAVGNWCGGLAVTGGVVVVHPCVWAGEAVGSPAMRISRSANLESLPSLVSHLYRPPFLPSRRYIGHPLAENFICAVLEHLLLAKATLRKRRGCGGGQFQTLLRRLSQPSATAPGLTKSMLPTTSRLATQNKFDPRIPGAHHGVLIEL